MPPLGSLTQAWTAAEAALPLGWHVAGLYRFDDHASGAGQYAERALRRLSDRLRERRGVIAG